MSRLKNEVRSFTRYFLSKQGVRTHAHKQDQGARAAFLNDEGDN